MPTYEIAKDTKEFQEEIMNKIFFYINRKESPVDENDILQLFTGTAKGSKGVTDALAELVKQNKIVMNP